MKKIILQISMSFIVILSLTVTAFAESSVTDGVYSGYLGQSTYSQYSKKYTSTTQKHYGTVYEITAGLSVLNSTTGGTLSDSFNRLYNAKTVTASGLVNYGITKKVTAYGSHSAYQNGVAQFFEFTAKSYTM